MNRLVTLVLVGGTVSAAEPLPFDPAAKDALAAGSELGAGIDANAGQEITRPSDLGSLKAGLRTVGGVFQNGSGSAALQFNPLLTTYARTREYHELVARRENVAFRLLEDLAVTAVLSAGTPYAADDPSRFSTFGFGITTEALGARGTFSPVFDECLNGAEWRAKETELLDAIPPISDSNPRKGESPADFMHRIETDYKPHREKALQELLTQMRARIETCRDRARDNTDAVYVTLGGRFIGPGPAHQSGDAVQVDREFFGAAYELYKIPGVRVDVQTRLIGQRHALNQDLQYSLDAGLALQWSSESVSISAEAVRSAAQLNGGATTASLATTLKVKLPSRVVLGVELQGRGSDIGPAFRSSTVAVSLIYAEATLFNKKLPLPQ